MGKLIVTLILALIGYLVLELLFNLPNSIRTIIIIAFSIWYHSSSGKE